MALLIFSSKCNHSQDVLEYIQEHPQLKSMIQFHNVDTQGIPHQYVQILKRVPSLITKDGKLLVGGEVKGWLGTLLPSEEFVGWGSSGTASTNLEDAEPDSCIFNLDSYGSTLKPTITRELQERINASVNDAYNDIKK